MCIYTLGSGRAHSDHRYLNKEHYGLCSCDPCAHHHQQRKITRRKHLISSIKRRLCTAEITVVPTKCKNISMP